MKTIKYEQSTNDGCGTSFRGCMHASYRDLVEMFGEPQWGESGDSKCTFTYVIDYYFNDNGDEDHGTFTLYDWKGNRPYDDNEEFEVHVGGLYVMDLVAAQRAQSIFKRTDVRFTADKGCMLDETLNWLIPEVA